MTKQTKLLISMMQCKMINVDFESVAKKQEEMKAGQFTLCMSNWDFFTSPGLRGAARTGFFT
jgi:hypothetical protein